MEQVVIQTKSKPITCYSRDAGNSMRMHFISNILEGFPKTPLKEPYTETINWHSHTNKPDRILWFKQSNLYKHKNTAAISAFSCSVLCSSLAANFYIFILSHGSVILHRMDRTEETPLLHCAYFKKLAQH